MTMANFNRFSDELCGLLAQYWPLKDKLRLICVSKQFQKTICNKQIILEICEAPGQNSVNLTKVTDLDTQVLIDLKKLEQILKIASRIEEINLSMLECSRLKTTINNIDDVLMVLVNNCPNLKKFRIRCDFNEVSSQVFMSFHQRFGNQLEFIGLPSKDCESYGFCVQLIQFCPNLTGLDNLSLNTRNLIDFNTISQNITKIENIYFCSSDLENYEQFCDHFGPKLTHLSINFANHSAIDEHKFIARLPGFKNIKVLIIETNIGEKDDDPAQIIWCFENIAKNFQKLQKLELRIRKLSQIFFNCFENFRNLKHLKIVCINARNHHQDDLNSLNLPKGLFYLCLQNFIINDNFLNDFQEILPCLTNLQLQVPKNNPNYNEMQINTLREMDKRKHLKINYNEETILADS